MSQGWRRASCVLLLLLGTLSLGQGGYIYAKAALAQVLLQQAWAATRSGDEQARPWPWADTWPVARLLSPRHAVDLIVLEGATGNSTAFAPGHIQGTALPGADGNVALAAHRDTHFRFLRNVQQGEELWLELPGGDVQRYEVQSLSVVDERDTRLLETPGSWLTLVTCYPFDAVAPGGPLRFVVQAKRAPPPRVIAGVSGAPSQAVMPSYVRGH